MPRLERWFRWATATFSPSLDEQFKSIGRLYARMAHSRGLQVAKRDCKNRSLWVNLWVRIRNSGVAAISILGIERGTLLIRCPFNYAITGIEADPRFQASVVAPSPSRHPLTLLEVPAQHQPKFSVRLIEV